MSKTMVVGLMFSPDKKKVVLIKKNRPPWQAGRLNGIGGKVEPGEAIISAMIREFEEETGVLTSGTQWNPVVKLYVNDVVVWFHWTIDRAYTQVQSMTDEMVCIRHIDRLQYGTETIQNLSWIIPMCLAETPVFSNVYE